MFQYYFKYRDTVSYRDIFVSDTQYYYLVVSHIPSIYIVPDFIQFTCYDGSYTLNKVIVNCILLSSLYCNVWIHFTFICDSIY